MPVCKRCDYSWQSVVDSPRQCPHCKNPRWNEERRPPGRKPLGHSINGVPVDKVEMTGYIGPGPDVTVKVTKSELEQEAEFQDSYVDTSEEFAQ